ncbi:MAG TPA: hypothetical protein VM370_08390 [Candidatus Thermoplasmatota archaeon]|nr:hypothetical protein [Candidatus Thermoplasmatota archaeon]
MDVVELGGMRLHLLTAYPGIPGEAERVTRTLGRIGPAMVLGDLDTEDALRLRASFTDKKKPFEPGFVDRLFQEEMRRRFAADVKPGEHPLAAAARFTREKRLDFVPIRPIAGAPGFLARRRATKAARAIEVRAPEEYPHAFEVALEAVDVWHSHAEADGAQKRLVRALSEGRAPVVAVLQAHRQAAFEDLVLRTGRIPA